MTLAEELLQGAIDIHVHSSPCLYKRLYDHAELASEAKKAGMRAIVLKSHHLGTADRAYFVRKMVPGIDVFGSITLNFAVGGLNPFAVDAALRLGARVVWMPTVDAEFHRQAFGGTGQYTRPSLRVEGKLPAFYSKKPAMRLTTDSGDLVPELWDIIDLVAKANVVLICGHQSIPEKEALIKCARQAGVKKVILDHPQDPFTVPVEKQKELVAMGAMVNYVYLRVRDGVQPIETVASEIREVGAENIVISTDLGQIDGPPPAEGLKSFIEGLLEVGIRRDAIDLMVRRNPAKLLYE